MRSRVVVIGAGPIGIEVAAGLKRAGIDFLHFDAGPVAATIYAWPRHARFFSSPERVAVAGIPFWSKDQEQPSREDYLAYLRGVVETVGLKIHTYHRVTGISGSAGDFRLRVENRSGEFEVRTEAAVLAVGDMTRVNRLGIPGEDLPQVSHILEDPHLYFGNRLLVVGGKNSALEAALRCFRSGARVSISYRRDGFDRERVNSRLHLELSILTRKGTIPFYPETVPVEINNDGVRLRRADGGEIFLETDFVLLATGYHADLSLFRAAGIELDDEGVPLFDPATMETNCPGIYLAGTAVSGARQRYKDFVGTSHHHAAGIVRALSGLEVPTGTIPSRRYDFNSDDIKAD